MARACIAKRVRWLRSRLWLSLPGGYVGLRIVALCFLKLRARQDGAPGPVVLH